MNKDDVLLELDLDAQEPQPEYHEGDPGAQWETLEYTSPLGLSSWGFAWDGAFWAWYSQRQGRMMHEARGFWAEGEPNWEIMRAELRVCSNYVKED